MNIVFVEISPEHSTCEYYSWTLYLWRFLLNILRVNITPEQWICKGCWFWAVYLWQKRWWQIWNISIFSLGLKKEKIC